MALAILELLDFDRANVRFKIDTGTNRYYQLKVGRNAERKHGIDWVGEVYFATPMSINEVGGGLLNSAKEVSIPASRLGDAVGGKVYVQLFSFKTAQGKSPAFSRVVRVPLGVTIPDGAPPDLAPSFSMSTSMNTIDSFRAPRKIPCRTYGEVYSQQASLEDLLSSVIKLAAPAVVSLLGGGQSNGKQNGASGAGGGAGQADILAQLLKTILGSLQSGAVAAPAVSHSQSLAGPSSHDNRFAGGGNRQFSRPFIFGIDDALIGSMIGPLIQVLPQLLNAANQRRVQMKQADNKLVTDLVSEVNRRMILNQLLEAQKQAPAAGAQPGSTADLSQLIQLLQQASAAGATAQPGAAATPTTPTPTTPPVAASQSLSLDGASSSAISSKAVVSFVTAEPVPWNGSPKLLFAKGQAIQLKLRLNVAEPAPKTPLPKAILKIVFKDGSNQSVLYEKKFKQKDVMPNSEMTFQFATDELARLPANKNITVLAEMRWLTSKTRKEYKALGSTEIVLVNKYFLKEQGGSGESPEQELTDLNRFRAFWNKIWEAPTLSAGGGRGDGEKRLWELSVSAKYSVLLSAEHDTNGLMETKILKNPSDLDSISEATKGRMKAGIELSMAELNKLLPLWNDRPALDREKLEALSTADFVKNNASEFVYNFRLKGRARERGMIWVGPVFKLFECTLSNIAKTDDAGQVIAMAEEKVHFPLPVAARVIGLKSES